jgi:hypothetical protein
MNAATHGQKGARERSGRLFCLTPLQEGSDNKEPEPG